MARSKYKRRIIGFALKGLCALIIISITGLLVWRMLDNMSLSDMKKCVRICRGISKTEASGGITLERAKEVAATGVTAISLGCLTHSAGSIDLSLEWSAV